jgi:uncharacterized C2H2 Zn-finger protein
MADQIHTINLEEEFKNCPLCSYNGGFHSMLKRDGEEIKWLFVCPSCNEVFDVGQTLKK